MKPERQTYLELVHRPVTQWLMICKICGQLGPVPQNAFWEGLQLILQHETTHHAVSP
jgi:hypothetical protein